MRISTFNTPFSLRRSRGSGTRLPGAGRVQGSGVPTAALAGAVLLTETAAQRSSAASRARSFVNLACPRTALRGSVAMSQEFVSVHFLLRNWHWGRLLLRGSFLFRWGGSRWRCRGGYGFHWSRLRGVQGREGSRRQRSRSLVLNERRRSHGVLRRGFIRNPQALVPRGDRQRHEKGNAREPPHQKPLIHALVPKGQGAKTHNHSCRS